MQRTILRRQLRPDLIVRVLARHWFVVGHFQVSLTKSFNPCGYLTSG